MGEAQMMTLVEYVSQLPRHHLARRQYSALLARVPDMTIEEAQEAYNAAEPAEEDKTWKCPECDTKMVVCDEAGVIALDRLAEDKAEEQADEK